jgi:hypothetical protein
MPNQNENNTAGSYGKKAHGRFPLVPDTFLILGPESELFGSLLSKVPSPTNPFSELAGHAVGKAHMLLKSISPYTACEVVEYSVTKYRSLMGSSLVCILTACEVLVCRVQKTMKP